MDGDGFLKWFLRLVAAVIVIVTGIVVWGIVEIVQSVNH